VWCHGDRETGPTWTDETGHWRECDACHDAPPSSHARFARLAVVPDGCATCHAAQTGPTHVDGTLDLAVPEPCGTCHGTGDDGAPPVALDGSVDIGDPGVGAHQRHLDVNLPDRVGRALECSICHVVPSSWDDAGHLDVDSPAEVDLGALGSYDPATRTCAVTCHGDRRPVWNDASGSERACGTCHLLPPPPPHLDFGSDLEDCLLCHSFEVDTHVDGEVTP
jgi:hypothetical protein